MGFERLSVELAMEIIALAATPVFQLPRGHYATARALCLVSHSVRNATMPHLLRTISLATATHVLDFITSLRLQVYLRSMDSRLAVNYTRYVQRLWIEDACEPPFDTPPEGQPDYKLLYDLMRRIPTLGMNTMAQHFLYRGFECPGSDPANDWECLRITFAGNLIRWNPFTQSAGGQAFLAKITRLVIWIHSEKPASDVEEDLLSFGKPAPEWLVSVPFAKMPRLTHFACLCQSMDHCNDAAMCVYVAPSQVECGIDRFTPWAHMHTPLGEDLVVELESTTQKHDWWGAYVRGESDVIWRVKGRETPSQLDEEQMR